MDFESFRNIYEANFGRIVSGLPEWQKLAEEFQNENIFRGACGKLARKIAEIKASNPSCYIPPPRLIEIRNAFYERVRELKYNQENDKPDPDCIYCHGSGQVCIAVGDGGKPIVPEESLLQNTEENIKSPMPRKVYRGIEVIGCPVCRRKWFKSESFRSTVERACFREDFDWGKLFARFRQ